MSLSSDFQSSGELIQQKDSLLLVVYLKPCCHRDATMSHCPERRGACGPTRRIINDPTSRQSTRDKACSHKSNDQFDLKTASRLGAVGEAPGRRKEYDAVDCCRGVPVRTVGTVPGQFLRVALPSSDR